MAAGALSRSRGAAGVPTTKRLYFIFTLLCLVCLASSLTTQERLDKAKKMLKNLEQKIAKAKAAYKADRGFASELMDQYMRFLDPMTEMLKKTSSDFPPLLDLMECLKTFMKKSKAHIDTLEDEEVVEKIESYEEKVMELKQLIKHLEENEYEL